MDPKLLLEKVQNHIYGNLDFLIFSLSEISFSNEDQKTFFTFPKPPSQFIRSSKDLEFSPRLFGPEPIFYDISYEQVMDQENSTEPSALPNNTSHRWSISGVFKGFWN